MRLCAKAVSGQKVELKNPVSLLFDSEDGAPADSLFASFALDAPPPELCEVTAFDDDGVRFFAGVVDEQTQSAGGDGALFSIAARGYAALLLDNEALPQTYQLPSLKLLYARHAAPYGFAGVKGNLSAYTGKLQVNKGMSEWGVLSAFCRDYLKVTPVVTMDMVFDATGNKEGARRVFGAGGIPVLSAEASMKRCEEISEVYVRAGRDGGYKTLVKNPGALLRGVKRRRYVNAGESTVTPVSFGSRLISEGEKKAFSLTLVCPGFVKAQVHDSALVNLPAFGLYEGLTIQKKKVVRRAQGELTTLTLRRA